MRERRVGSGELSGSQPATLIIGLGNPLRADDGIGPRVVEELVRRGLPEGITARDCGTGGLDLLRVVEGWERVVVVDAADVEREPGEFVRFTPDQVRLAEAVDSFSLHDAGLAEALGLARAAGRSLPSMVIFGVQPERIDWAVGLSPTLEAALPALVEAVLGEVGEYDDSQDTDY
ncbi:MAG: hydrogenase maturation protease [Anaerolineae bacterium]|jgi:hydrogenase maturation protease